MINMPVIVVMAVFSQAIHIITFLSHEKNEFQ